MRYRALPNAIASSLAQLKYAGVPVDAGHWQGVPTEGKPDLMTTELLGMAFTVPMPITKQDAQDLIMPNLPWAEIEHAERVGGEPHNPHHSLELWPWWRGQDDSAMVTMHLGPGKTEPQIPQIYEKVFSHTYSERFWPKYAGRTFNAAPPNGTDGNWGIRYRYGDLNDLVNLLREHPHTRQAYLPIFLPEDTGAVHGGRVPCTLGYHFMLRNDRLCLWYDIRSCDAVRHFRDDIYLAVRLCQWVLEQLTGDEARVRDPLDWADVVPGDLHFSAHSFHVHAGDRHLLP